MDFRKTVYVGVLFIALLFISSESKAGFWVKKSAHKAATESESPARTRVQLKQLRHLEELANYAAAPASDSIRTSHASHGRNVPAVLSLVSALLPIAGLIVGAAIGGPWGAVYFFYIPLIPASIAAVVLGIIGLKRKNHRGMAVAGLVVGGILMLLMAVTILSTTAYM